MEKVVEEAIFIPQRIDCLKFRINFKRAFRRAALLFKEG